MTRNDLPALAIFAAIVDAGSFRAAARRLNLSVSTLSQSLRALEERLGLRLLHRSTRSLAPTEAGAHLLARLTPALAQIDRTLEALRDRNHAPAGMLRLNLPHSAGRLALAPMLSGFLIAYPEIRLDLLADDRLVDIVAAGCDAGIRLHEAIQGDMIAHPIGPPLLRLAVGGSLAYLACRGRPEQPADLAQHECLGQYFMDRQPFAWQFAQGEVHIQIQPSGRMISNDPALLIGAARDGVGLAMSFADDIRRAGLEIVLASWCQPFAGFQIYYPGRRHPPPALRALLRFSRNWYRAAGS